MHTHSLLTPVFCFSQLKGSKQIVYADFTQDIHCRNEPKIASPCIFCK